MKLKNLTITELWSNLINYLMNESGGFMKKLAEYIKYGKGIETANRVKQLIDEGANPETLLNDAMIPVMDEVGALFQSGEFFMPEMLIAARAMQQGMDIIKPILVAKGIKPIGTVVIGTVHGDLHDLGKNLVIMALEGAGFQVVDLGVDVSATKFINAINDHNPLAVSLSALLSSTMLVMKDTVAEIQKAHAEKKIKIMIGGAPLNKEFAQEINADFFGVDPQSAKDFVRSLL